MKRQLVVLSEVLSESASWLRINPARDWMTIQKRVEHEGDSFLEITLPAMHDALMLSVSQARWIPNRLWKQSRQGSPVFLQEFLGRVFDFGVDGHPIKESNDVSLALRAIRQILLLNGKVKALPTPSRQKRAIDEFFNTERELRDKRKFILEAAGSEDFLRICSVLFADLFSDVERHLDEIKPKHGPGQTAESSFGIRKYSTISDTWTARLNAVLPASFYGFYSYSDLADRTDGSWDFPVIPPVSETPMRITAVPKTAKTPRLIAMEPTVNQYVQQGVLTLLDRKINERSLLRGSVSWRDQTRNRLLASKGSEDRSLATLDLSEASDRLHVGVVRNMLRRHPLLKGIVFASRSRQAAYEDKVIFLHKFAPMGSALCFAFESLAFLAISILGVARARDVHLSRNTITRIARQVSVYGDDIIVPTDCASQVADTLESFGLKVNRRKSFWTGEFRESCGAEFFRGVDVSVVRLREKFDSSLRQPRNMVSWTETQQLFFEKGWFCVAESMAKAIPSVPICPPGYYAGLCFFGFSISGKTRWNRDYQRLEILSPSLVFHDKTDYSLGRELLFHWLLTKDRKEISDTTGVKPGAWSRSIIDRLIPDEEQAPSVGRPSLVRTRLRYMALH